MKLYILGNGFDLKHGLPTRYSDFADFCKIKDPNLYELINQTFPNITTNSLWSNFEEGLGTPDSSAIESDYQLLGDKSIQDYSLHFKSFIDEAFREWIISIKRLTSLLQKHYILDENSVYLSFNYTDVLETLYGIKSNILHIHDFAQKDEEECFTGYIFGHSINKLDFYNNDINVFINVFAKEYKEYELNGFLCKTIHQNENVEIIVLGHSMNQIDDKYFKFINNKYPESIWHIFYYNDIDYYSKLKSISRLNINYFELLKC